MKPVRKLVSWAGQGNERKAEGLLLVRKSTLIGHTIESAVQDVLRLEKYL